MSTLIKRETMKAIVLPDSNYIKQKNGKHIYKNKYTEEYYVIYKDNTGTNWIVETWSEGCNC